MNPNRISILEAVQTSLTDNFSDFSVWTGEVPEGESMPFGMIEIDSSTLEFTSESIDLETTHFTIYIFAIGADIVDNLVDKIQAYLNEEAIDNLILQNGDRVVYLLPARRNLGSIFMRDKDQNEIFRGSATFEAAVWRY